MHKVELLDSSEFKDKKVYYKHLFNKYKHWLKYLIYVILWLIGGRIAIKYQLQGLYVIISGFVLIFTNLGTREKGALSAYSIFNKGFKTLIGQMTEQDVANMYTIGNKKQQVENISDDEEINVGKEFEGLTMEQMMSKITKLGNKQCFCNSGRKYKKCHYYIHQRIQQEQDEERRKSQKQK